MSKKKQCYIPERRGKVGGQAVLEGVMMKSGENIAITVRREDGTKVTEVSKFSSVRKKCAFFRIPIIRGIVNFIEMMIMSLNTLNKSATMLGVEEEMQETKFEKWLKKHFGKSVMDFIMVVAMVLGVALALFLFIYLPTLYNSYRKSNGRYRSLERRYRRRHKNRNLHRISAPGLSYEGHKTNIRIPRSRAQIRILL